MPDLQPFEALALSMQMNPGTYALLLGSGISRAAGIPTGWEITLSLVKRLAAAQEVTLQPDEVEQWYVSRYGKSPSYSELLDTLSLTSAERRNIVAGFIEPNEDGENRRPTKAHSAIASMVVQGLVRVIITTNFDRLLENALRDAGIEPTVIASEDAIAGAVPLIHSKCTIIKVHGDYLDERILNTDRELTTYSNGLNRLLDQVFDDFALLVVGWSADWDHALRHSLERIRGRRYPTFWAAKTDPTGLAADLVMQRGAKIVPISDAESFLPKLLSTVEALISADRISPLSAKMAVSAAKKLTRDPELLMEWTEMLAEEVAAVRQFVVANWPTTTPNAADINALLVKIDSGTERLRRILMVCGRWGTSESVSAALRAIRGVSFKTETQGGYNVWISMRELPACLCFYWLLAGAIAREDLPRCKMILHAKIREERRELDMVSALTLNQPDLDWKWLTGHENKYFPQSEFFRPLLASESTDIALSLSEGVDLAQDTEQLISLEFAYLRWQRAADGSIWFFAPGGSYLWRNDGGYIGELAKLRAGALIEAGLLGGTEQTEEATYGELTKHFSRFVH